MKPRHSNDYNRLAPTPGDLAILIAIIWVVSCVLFPVFTSSKHHSGPTFLSNIKPISPSFPGGKDAPGFAP